jgi:hypothetical protein
MFKETGMRFYNMYSLAELLNEPLWSIQNAHRAGVPKPTTTRIGKRYVYNEEDVQKMRQYLEHPNRPPRRGKAN